MRHAPTNSMHCDVSLVDYTSVSLLGYSPSGTFVCVDVDNDGNDEVLFSSNKDRSMAMIKGGTIYVVAEFDNAYPIVEMTASSPSPSLNTTLFITRMDGSLSAYTMESASTSPTPSYSLVPRGYIKSHAGVKHLQTFTYDDAATPSFTLLDTLQISEEEESDSIASVAVVSGEFLLLGLQRGGILVYQLLAALPRRMTQEDLLAESPLTVSMRLEMRQVHPASALPLPLFPCAATFAPCRSPSTAPAMFGVCWLDGRVCLCVIEEHAIPCWRAVITIQTSIPASSLHIVPYASSAPSTPVPSPRRRREAMCNPTTSRSSDDDHMKIHEGEEALDSGNDASFAAIVADTEGVDAAIHNDHQSNNPKQDENGWSSSSSSYVVIDEETPPLLTAPTEGNTVTPVTTPAATSVSPTPLTAIPSLLMIATGVSGQTLFLTIPQVSTVGGNAPSPVFTVYCFNAANRFTSSRASKRSGIFLSAAIAKQISSTVDNNRVSYDLHYLSSTDHLFSLPNINLTLTQLNNSKCRVISAVFNQTELQTAATWHIQEIGSAGHISRNAHRVTTSTCTLYNDNNNTGSAKSKIAPPPPLVDILMRLPIEELSALQSSIRSMM